MTRMVVPRGTVVLAVLVGVGAAAQSPPSIERNSANPGVVTTRQTITPAGVQSVFEGKVFGVAFGRSGSELWVSSAKGRTTISRLDWKANRLVERFERPGGPGLQGILFDRVSGRVLVSAAASPAARTPLSGELLAVDAGGLRVLAGKLGGPITGALAAAVKANADGQRLAALPLIYDNRLAIVDLASDRLLGMVSTGIAPFGAAVDDEGSVAYVTNWGGRPAGPTELSAPAGKAVLEPGEPGQPKEPDRVVVDARGVAASGTVTRIDLRQLKATHTVPVGLHPTAIVWDQPRHLVYVANSNSDSVSVIDATRQVVSHTISLQPFQQHVAGVAPTALALSSDGSTLYVACGGINAIAIVKTRERTIEGLIPTAWYPSSLSLSSDGRLLAVGNLLGIGSGWSDKPGPDEVFFPPPYGPTRRNALIFRGSISVLDLPDEAQLAGYTTAVAENNHLALGSAPSSPPASSRKVLESRAVPARAGDPSLIDHVVYIIKENRTYDQVFGDMSKGNGDASLAIFPESVTPNHHRLADQFVLLDNFYATGGNSGDGHQWVTQANETAYCMWPGWRGRSYPFDGSDPIAYAQGGFIWDAAIAKKRTVRIFGEFVADMENAPSRSDRPRLLDEWRDGADFRGRWVARPEVQGMKPHVAPDFPSYSLYIPDVVRAQLFLGELKRWEATGQMPNLVLIQLPSDHTVFFTPGVSSPKAMLADNDLALGQIVEGLTRTPFWKKMAIFVVEDDAQHGVDHVDGHRTAALTISPYVRRGHVDSTFYSNPSMLKTIELMLGLPTLSLFDLIANDMRPSFTNEADATPYTAVVPSQSLHEVNPPLKSLSGAARRAALDSLAMRLDVPDAAPTERGNRILWHALRGWTTPYPATKQSAFAPLAVDLDDDERR